jgi:hypothetical protein
VPTLKIANAYHAMLSMNTGKFAEIVLKTLTTDSMYAFARPI